MRRFLTFKDRQVIENMIKKGCSVLEISNEMGFDISTIYRELKRGGLEKKELYSAEKAQKDFNNIKKKKKRNIKTNSIDIDKLKKLNEYLRMGQIGIKEIFAKVAISRNTLYNNIAKGNLPDISVKYYAKNKRG